jgi:hypothetical protein
MQASLMARVYKQNWRAWAFPVFLFVLGNYCVVGLMKGTLHPTRRFGMFSAVGLLVGGGILAAVAFTTRLILTDDAIELRSILQKNRLTLGEIRGRREVIVAGRLGLADSWKLVPNDSRARTINVGSYFTLDDAFYEWLDKIPSLDAEDES